MRGASDFPKTRVKSRTRRWNRRMANLGAWADRITFEEIRKKPGSTSHTLSRRCGAYWAQRLRTLAQARQYREHQASPKFQLRRIEDRDWEP